LKREGGEGDEEGKRKEKTKQYVCGFESRK
jgi:hypothetical protein